MEDVQRTTAEDGQAFDCGGRFSGIPAEEVRSVILEKALKKAGLRLIGDKLPKDQRTQRVFMILIACCREEIAEEMDKALKYERQLHDSQRINLELHERIRVLEAENTKFRLKEKLEQFSTLTIEDRRKLLEDSGKQNGTN